MATRRFLPTGPVLDNTAAKETDKLKQTYALSKKNFNTVLRGILLGGRLQSRGLATAAFDRLKVLGIKPDKSRVFAGRTPKGSDQFDGHSISFWMKRVQKKHRKAVSQIQTIYATAQARG